MQILWGQPVSPGYAKGIAVVYDRGTSIEVPRYRIGQVQVDGELDRFEQALEASCHELKQLERRVLSDLGDSLSSIFSSHLTFLNDPQFTARVRERIRDDLLNAEQAIDMQVVEMMHLIESVENGYLRERARDIRDLGNRLLRQLTRDVTLRYVTLPPESVIVAGDLLPSETIDLDRNHLVGIVTEEGGVNSHAAILARAMGIPAVTAVADATSLIEFGSKLLIDGNTGSVTISPTEAATADLTRLKVQYDEASASAVAAEGLASTTSDGVHVSLSANLNRVEEVNLVETHRLDGVGLFRTEFLYMDSPTEPTFERQVDVYQRVLEGLHGRKLVVRTLDLGGDKVPLFLQRRSEAIPSLGSRGLRFSLAQPELFSTQVRALLTASQCGDLWILFPMVFGEYDLHQACQKVESLADELKLSKLPRLGAMIETPAALFSLNQILKQVDFVSIGTNDLTQFMLAADRDAVGMIDEYSVLHPSVLRAIRRVVEVCNDTGRDVSVCGEAAGMLETAGLFVGLGVRHLSMSPVRAARVRLGIRSAHSDELAELANNALKSNSAAAVKTLLKEFHRKVGVNCS